MYLPDLSRWLVDCTIHSIIFRLVLLPYISRYYTRNTDRLFKNQILTEKTTSIFRKVYTVHKTHIPQKHIKSYVFKKPFFFFFLKISNYLENKSVIVSCTVLFLLTQTGTLSCDDLILFPTIAIVYSIN